MNKVSQLFIYPIKSMGGIEVSSAEVNDRGFQYDRHWMLVDENNQFMTQRQNPSMALLQTTINNDSLRVFYKINPAENISIPFATEHRNRISVKVWEDTCEAIEEVDSCNEWFSDILKTKCKLVYMPDDSIRKVDTQYASNGEITSFSDGYPILLIGQASLDDLNGRLEESIPMNRFRPNMVFSGGYPFEEDEMEEFKIGTIHFFGVKLCARCDLTTIDQENAIKNKEPLKTLSSYRQCENKIYFGQNLLHKGTGIISINDSLEVLKRKQGLSGLS